MAKNGGAVISLPGKIGIERCAGLKIKLEKIKSTYKALMLDFRKVDEIDLAGIQLITSFLLDCSSAGIEFGCLGPLNSRISRIMKISGVLVNVDEGDYLFPFLFEKGVKVEHR